MKLDDSPWLLLLPLFLACEARADVRLTMEVTTTSMSIVAPELHVLIRNDGDEVGSYGLRLRSVSSGAIAGCNLDTESPTSNRPGAAWREQLAHGRTGSIAPHGFAHRVHAFDGAARLPCAVEWPID